MNNRPVTRRDFVKAAAVTTAAFSTFSILGAQTAVGVHTGKIKVGLIGCGGRGTGALKNFMEAAQFPPGAFRCLRASGETLFH